MSVKIVVAYDEEFGIGKNNRLPWHIPGDLKRFKALTVPHVVVMGANTWNGLPAKLPNRTNVVVSRGKTELLPYADYIVNSLEAALKQFAAKEIFIIGGECLYRSALEADVVDEIIATEVEGKHSSDTFFPDPTPFGWHRMLDGVKDGFRLVSWHKKKWA